MRQAAQNAAAAAEKAAAAAQKAAAAADKIAAQATQAQVSGVARELLVQKREEIKNQLNELTERRRELQSQMDQMNPVSGRGHQARIAVIDQRSSALETELFAVNDQLGSLPSDGSFEYTATQPNDIADEVRSAVGDAVAESFAAGVFSLLGIWVLWRGFRRFIWKRKPAAGLADNTVQLAQLQASMDVMAIEIERISEAQRFSARLLNERVLAGGEAQPVGARNRP